MKKLFVLLAFSLFLTKGFSQTGSWKGLWGFGVSQSTYKVADIDLQNNLIGGHAFFELPVLGENTPFRLEINYLKRTGDTLVNSNNISSYWNIKLMYGKILGTGKRLQFPIFIGGSYNATSGAWNLPSWGLTGKAGLRFFVTKKISIYGEAGIDGMLVSDVGIRYSNGKTETKSLYPINTHLNVGFIFSNF